MRRRFFVFFSHHPILCFRLALLVGWFSAAVSGSRHHTYDTYLHTQGVRGIYRGFDVAVLGVGAWRALYFGLYDTLTTRLLGGRQGGTIQQRWAVAQLVTSSAGT